MSLSNADIAARLQELTGSSGSNVIDSLRRSLETSRVNTEVLSRGSAALEGEYQAQRQLLASQLRQQEQLAREQRAVARQAAERQRVQAEIAENAQAEAARIYQRALNSVTGGDEERLRVLTEQGQLSTLVQREIEADFAVLQARGDHLDEGTGALNFIGQATALAGQTASANVLADQQRLGVDAATLNAQVSRQQEADDANFLENFAQSSGAAVTRGVGGLAGLIPAAAGGAINLVDGIIGDGENAVGDALISAGGTIARGADAVADSFDNVTTAELAANQQFGAAAQQFLDNPSLATAGQAALDTGRTLLTPGGFSTAIEQVTGALAGGGVLTGGARAAGRATGLVTTPAAGASIRAGGAPAASVGTPAIAVGQGGEFASTVADNPNIDVGTQALGNTAAIAGGAAAGRLVGALGGETIEAAAANLGRGVGAGNAARSGLIGGTANVAGAGLRGAGGEAVQEATESGIAGVGTALASGASNQDALIQGAGSAVTGAAAGGVLGGAIAAPRGAVRDREALARRQRADFRERQGLTDSSGSVIPASQAAPSNVLNQLSDQQIEGLFLDYETSTPQQQQAVIRQIGEAAGATPDRISEAVQSASNLVSTAAPDGRFATPQQVREELARRLDVNFTQDQAGQVVTSDGIVEEITSTFDNQGGPNAQGVTVDPNLTVDRNPLAVGPGVEADASLGIGRDALTGVTADPSLAGTVDVDPSLGVGRDAFPGVTAEDDLGTGRNALQGVTADQALAPENFTNQVPQTEVQDNVPALPPLVTAPDQPQLADSVDSAELLLDPAVERQRNIQQRQTVLQQRLQQAAVTEAEDAQITLSLESPDVTPTIRRIASATATGNGGIDGAELTSTDLAEGVTIREARDVSRRLNRVLGTAFRGNTPRLGRFTRERLNQPLVPRNGNTITEQQQQAIADRSRQFLNLLTPEARTRFTRSAVGAEAAAVTEGPPTGESLAGVSQTPADSVAGIPAEVPQTGVATPSQTNSSASSPDATPPESSTPVVGAIAEALERPPANEIPNGPRVDSVDLQQAQFEALRELDAGNFNRARAFVQRTEELRNGVRADLGREDFRQAIQSRLLPNASTAFFFSQNEDQGGPPPLRPANGLGPQDTTLIQLSDGGYVDRETGEYFHALSQSRNDYRHLQEVGRELDSSGSTATPQEINSAIRGVLTGTLQSVEVIPFNGPSDPVLDDTVGLDPVDELTDGFVFRGRLYYNTENIRTVSEARLLAAHEGIGHLGLRNRFGPNLRPVLSDFYERIGGLDATIEMGARLGLDLPTVYPGLVQEARNGLPEAQQQIIEELVAQGAENEFIAEPTTRRLIGNAISDLVSRIREWASRVPGLSEVFGRFDDRDLMRLVRETARDARRAPLVQDTEENIRQRRRLVNTTFDRLVGRQGQTIIRAGDQVIAIDRSGATVEGDTAADRAEQVRNVRRDLSETVTGHTSALYQQFQKNPRAVIGKPRSTGLRQGIVNHPTYQNLSLIHI